MRAFTSLVGTVVAAFTAAQTTYPACASFSIITASLSTAFTFSYSTPTIGIGWFLTTATVKKAGNGATTTRTSVLSAGAATATSGGSSQSGELTSSGSNGGLSACAKAGIGIGATVGGLLFICLIVLAFVYGRRSGRDKKKPEAPPSAPPERVDAYGKVELGGDSKSGFAVATAMVPVDVQQLNGEEKAESENRRRAKDLENGVIRESAVSPVATETHEVGGAERYELEALRREAGVRYELG
ncbi:uncharacterized protein PAC_11729 [Phialocephala subalpina]|uniref:Uncharacterized protein n=1 Tax=Phialocephala subalpina TaxID=576137 RepID=A0A1L7X9Z4_9HELO|nr:uncharacterized protein PAC_11729 [Phialocephala subalpina]